eukprot:351395-Chlamydomonas_euryale.AAC.4
MVARATPAWRGLVHERDAHTWPRHAGTCHVDNRQRHAGMRHAVACSHLLWACRRPAGVRCIRCLVHPPPDSQQWARPRFPSPPATVRCDRLGAKRERGTSCGMWRFVSTAGRRFYRPYAEHSR